MQATYWTITAASAVLAAIAALADRRRGKRDDLDRNRPGSLAADIDGRDPDRSAMRGARASVLIAP